MSRPLFSFLAVFAFGLCAAATAHAQFGGGFGGQQQGPTGGTGFTGQAGGFSQNSGFGQGSGNTSTGMFGSRTTGNGISSQGSASQFGNTGQNSGMFGQTPGGGPDTGQQQQTGVTGTERFTRQGRQAGSFVGADNQDTISLLSQMQGGALGGQNAMQGLNGALGQNGMNGQNGRNPNQMNQNGMGQNNNQRIKVRTTLKFGGVAPASPLASPVAVAKVQTRFAKMPQFQRLGPLQITVVGRTAVLSGKVPSEHERALAERVALLEPGISAVQNDLVVDPVATTAPAN